MVISEISKMYGQDSDPGNTIPVTFRDFCKSPSSCPAEISRDVPWPRNGVFLVERFHDCSLGSDATWTPPTYGCICPRFVQPTLGDIVTPRKSSSVPAALQISANQSSLNLARHRDAEETPLGVPMPAALRCWRSNSS